MADFIMKTGLNHNPDDENLLVGGHTLWRGGTRFVLKMMNFVVKMMNFVLKMMISVLKMMTFVFKMMNFAQAGQHQSPSRLRLRHDDRYVLQPRVCPTGRLVPDECCGRIPRLGYV